jgi:hypothetical protein
VKENMQKGFEDQCYNKHVSQEVTKALLNIKKKYFDDFTFKSIYSQFSVILISSFYEVLKNDEVYIELLSKENILLIKYPFKGYTFNFITFKGKRIN